MPSAVNTQTLAITGNLDGAFPDGAYFVNNALSLDLIPQTYAAAGTTLATSTQLGSTISLVTGASGTNGVNLPIAPQLGTTMTVYSSAATNALLVYPGTSTATINNGTAGAAASITARKPAIFVYSAAGAWILNLSA